MNDHCRYHKQGRVQDSQKGEGDDVVGGGGGSSNMILPNFP